MPADITDSDLMSLVEQRRLVRRAWWRKGESTVVLLVMLACAYGAGYIHANRNGDNQLAEQRHAHQNEIARMQATQTIDITTAASTAKDAAVTAAGAAAKVDATAAKVERATAPKGKP